MHIDAPLRIRASVWAAGAFGLLGTMLQLVLETGWWLPVVATAGGALIGQVVYTASHGAATGLFRILFATGGIDAGPGFSAEEALVMQGRHGEAAERFRQWLMAHPGDHEARLRLAAILVAPLGEVTEAEGLLAAVRDGGATPRQETAARQALIDLYASTGQRGRHMAELARFIDRYPGSAAAAGARQALQALKQAADTPGNAPSA